MVKRNQVMSYMICVSILGFLLRVLQLRYAFDSQGLMVGGHGIVAVLVVLSAAVALGLGLTCRALEPRPAYFDAFSDGILELAVTMAGAAALLLGSAARMGQGQSLIGAAGILAALCMMVIGVGRFRDRPAPAAIHLLLCAYLVAKLIVDFKHWSIDPAILDYCFSLLAMICAMCATYHLCGFCFDKGRRGKAAFWCLMGVFFTGVTLADGGAADRLITGGLGLWLLTNGWQLLETPLVLDPGE